MSFTRWLSERLGLSCRPASRRNTPAARRNVHFALEQLEDRCTPSNFSFTAALGGGHAAVSLQIAVEFPPSPVAPEIGTVSRLLPNGVIQAWPPAPITLPQSFDTAEPIHDLVPPNPCRGWLQAAQISSSVFVPPITAPGGVT